MRKCRAQAKIELNDWSLVCFEIVRMQARIVGGDTLPRQHAPLDHRVADVARQNRGKFIKFMAARSRGIIGTNRIATCKWSILLNQLTVVRKSRHDQGPASKPERSNVS